MFLVFLFNIIPPIVVVIHKRCFFPSHTRKRITARFHLDTHGLYVAGVAPFLPPVAEGWHAAHLWRQHVYAAQMFPTSHLEKKVLQLNKSCFLWHLCKTSKTGWLYRSTALPFQEYEAAAAAVSNEKQVWVWCGRFKQLHNEGCPPGGASYTQRT